MTSTPMNAAIPFSADEVSDMVWAKTGKSPVSIRAQALLVRAEFADGQIGVWRIEELVVSSAMSLRWTPAQYMDAEERLA